VASLRGYSPFTVLDRKYDGATTEMTDALRAYLRSRATDARQAREVLAELGRSA
jgi:hypothetical protein